MKRLLLAVGLATVLGASSGCCLIDRLFHCRPCGPYDSCGPGPGFDHGGFGGGGPCMNGCCAGGPPGSSAYAGPPGPPTGAVTYPYYTTRGPRDFLAVNPPSIGP